MKNWKLATVGILTVLVAAGCAGPAKKTQAPSSEYSALSGKVVETMDGGGYTYVLLERDGKKSWAAIPSTKVTVGQQLKLLPGGELTNFPSSALHRTFDKIIFSGGVDDGSLHGKAAKADYKLSETTLMEGKVAEAINAGTYTYLRIEKDGKSSWAAIPQVKVAVGDEVELQPGTEMGEFTSPTMGKKFDKIYFSGGLKKGGQPVAPAAAEAKEAKDAAASKETASAVPGLPSGHPKLDAAAAKAGEPEEAAPMTPVTGKVVETMNSGGYTYICLEKEGKKVWAAVPPMDVKVGQEVSLAPGLEMSNFNSKGLNRTFDKIIFSTGPMK
ncbi:MAG TPA: hypothetical protein VJ550_14060 [Geomonas sp.]|nr:hypothetical protein [Geomonas sp.]